MVAVLSALVEMSESVYNKVLHCLFADAFNVALILFRDPLFFG